MKKRHPIKTKRAAGAFVRFRHVFENSPNVKDKSEKNLGLQFTYLMSNADTKKRIKADHKKFVPLKMSKQTDKMIRLGRLC